MSLMLSRGKSSEQHRSESCVVQGDESRVEGLDTEEPDFLLQSQRGTFETAVYGGGEGL
jgi:hypothetical protein